MSNVKERNECGLMIRIGDLSRLSRVSVRMLRHYDQMGLLKPNQVDQASGYRSYSIEQLAKLNQIIFLRDTGFSLKDIGVLVEQDISAFEMKTMLTKRKIDLENNIAISQLNLAAVMDKLRRIEDENAIPKYDVTIKAVEGYTIASIQMIVPRIKDMSLYCYDLSSKLYKSLQRLAISAIGSEITFYHNRDYCEVDIDMEVGVVLCCNEEELARLRVSELTVRTLKNEEKVACLIHNGTYDGLEYAIVELLKWINVNGYKASGEVRELHLAGRSHVDGKVQNKTVLEFQIPIMK